MRLLTNAHRRALARLSYQRSHPYHPHVPASLSSSVGAAVHWHELLSQGPCANKAVQSLVLVPHVPASLSSAVGAAVHWHKLLSQGPCAEKAVQSASQLPMPTSSSLQLQPPEALQEVVSVKRWHHRPKRSQAVSSATVPPTEAQVPAGRKCIPLFGEYSDVPGSSQQTNMQRLLSLLSTGVS